MTNESGRHQRDAEVADLRTRVADAEDVLRAIHAGEVDAVMVADEHGQRVSALGGAYRQLTETMSEGVVTLSTDGVILYGNTRFSKLLGRPLDRVLGSALRDHLPPEDQEALDSILAQTGTEPRRVEMNLQTGDKGSVPVYLSVSRIPNKEAEMAFCLVFTDLSEQKHHEQIECLARFPSENPSPVLRVSVQGIVQYANTAANVLLPTIGAEIGGVVNAEWQAHIDAAVAKAHLVSIEVQAGDRAFTITLAPVIEHGYVNLYGRDITARRRGEEALREKEHLLSESQRLGHIGSWLWEGTGPISWSDEMYRLYGVSPETFTPTQESLIGLLHPDDAPSMQAWIEACAAGEKPGEEEYRVNLPDGTVRFLMGRGETDVDATGKMTFMAGTAQDITERKLAEQEHEKLQSQFTQAQKMESVGRLAGGVAHDFNNLLMGIMGYSQLCLDTIGPDHPIREWLDEINKGAERSAKLTHQLLAFARKQIIAPKVIDLNDAIASMLKLLRRLIGEDLSITLRPEQDVWPVKMDPVQIDQILANLCVNARDAIGGVGSITIETGNATLDESYCAGHAGAIPGEYALLTITDTGCGMDEETLTHIFEPFFTTKGEGEGTGLGLATVYGIVKQNDGYINVYSESGEGTAFKIYLPRLAASEAVQLAVGKPKPPTPGNETVLVVEDEKSIRITVHMFLEALGYTVLVAESPKEALLLAAAHPGQIDLLITDVIMPGMSGRDLAYRLLELRPTIKRLFISGFTADVIAQRGILDDGVNFLSKPFGRDALARKVREVMDGE